MKYKFILRSSYGNDSCALIQFAREMKLQSVCVLYSDTGWSSPTWDARVLRMEAWARTLGFDVHRTKSIGLADLVRAKQGWPRQGIQFCTQELKIIPAEKFLAVVDPLCLSVELIGKRRDESANRANTPVFVAQGEMQNVRRLWHPLAHYNEAMRNELLFRAGIAPLPHRSEECDPCINSNRADLRRLAKNKERIAYIKNLETELGHTSKGKPRTMFRPYRYMGATGIEEIIRWAESERGEFELDDGTGGGCDSGLCGS